MPVKVGSFKPTSMERVAELRRAKTRRSGDPGMAELMDALESGEPQEVPVGSEQTPKGMRIAIARAANRRGLAIEMFEDSNEQGAPVVVVVKSEPAASLQKTGPATASGNGRRRGRPKRQTDDQPTDNEAETRAGDGMTEAME